MVVNVPLGVPLKAVDDSGSVHVRAHDLAVVVDVFRPAFDVRRGHRSW